MNNYEMSLQNMSAPILLSQTTKSMDLRGIMAYAKKKGKKVVDLSAAEKAMFMR